MTELSDRLALDDLMDCLTGDDEVEDAEPVAPVTAPEPVTMREDGGAPSPALSAALNAVLRMAEDAVLLDKSGAGPAHDADRPQAAPRRSAHPPRPPSRAPVHAAPRRPAPPAAPERAPTRHPDPDPETAPATSGAESPPVAAAPPLELVNLAPKMTLGGFQPQTGADDPRHQALLAALPRPPARPMPDALRPAAVSEGAVARAADGPQRPENPHLIAMLQELSETLDSAESLIDASARARRQQAVPALAPPVVPPVAQPRSWLRERLTVAGLFLCLIAGIAGGIYGNLVDEDADWLADADTAAPAGDGSAPKSAAPPRAANLASVASASLASEDGNTAMPEPESPAEARPAPVVTTVPDDDRPARTVAVIHKPRIDTGPLFARGKALLSTGDVVAARLVLLRAARQGDGRAMLVLAQSYDPEFLDELGVYGVAPELDKAILWYQQAAAHQATPQDP